MSDFETECRAEWKKVFAGTMKCLVCGAEIKNGGTPKCRDRNTKLRQFIKNLFKIV